MFIRCIIVALLVFGCSDKDSGDDKDPGSECGPRPGGCDDVPEDFHMDPACGTTVCGAWELCTCEAGEWKVTYVDCFGCPDASGRDASRMDAVPGLERGNAGK